MNVIFQMAQLAKKPRKCCTKIKPVLIAPAISISILLYNKWIRDETRQQPLMNPNCCRDTGISRGFAFVTMATEHDAESAVSLEKHVVDGREIRVAISQDQTTPQSAKQ